MEISANLSVWSKAEADAAESRRARFSGREVVAPFGGRMD
jgi:hypothetical protein